MESRHVFVTGGTGAIGGYAVPALVDAGLTVSALARNAAKADVLREQGAHPVVVSLFDLDGLTEAFRGCDAVVNLATSLPSPERFLMKSAWAECMRIRTQGSATVAGAAGHAGVPRLVQESIAMLYRGGDDWIDEESPVDHYDIAEASHVAEANARRFGQSHGSAVILRFGLFYGPGAAQSEQIMRTAQRHIGFSAGRPDSYVSSIHLSDAAQAVVAALDCPGGTYNIVDDEPVTARENVRAMADAVGSTTWLSVPGRIALLLGDRAASMTHSLRVSNSRFRTTTDWRPRYPSVREGYPAMADRLRAGQ
ncbi:NAD-dependent epimerase/dehydratase family protein [Gordonia hankookensis]|uniref:NAD(P)-dependent oxidoreductase n=1 Tax=Gordonia hankookensis TaxID=589403 RepID=A0ABR7WKQ3_9ACTN|nr:NAD(P)-dependent oxidoreductase [Gordonia hankookensis]MBD1322472.1 NAD(P)-dependent oxidoreductase [Gordonia hankookensis]